MPLPTSLDCMRVLPSQADGLDELGLPSGHGAAAFANFKVLEMFLFNIVCFYDRYDYGSMGGNMPCYVSFEAMASRHLQRDGGCPSDKTKNKKRLPAFESLLSEPASKMCTGARYRCFAHRVFDDDDDDDDDGDEGEECIQMKWLTTGLG
jgi:hypothetical protein